MSAPTVSVVAGASSGLGSALCELFAARGHRVVALGHEAAIHGVAREVPGVLPITCDLTKASDLDRAFGVIEAERGPATHIVYNAHRLVLGPSADTSLDVLEDTWRVNCFGAFAVAKRALPSMRQRRAGSLVFTGATGSVRGGARSVAFASSKFALRGLAQSLARELSAEGIHVAHVVLDGLVWSERTRVRFAPEESACMSPHAIAAAYLSLIEQERSAWTHELDLRPWVERF